MSGGSFIYQKAKTLRTYRLMVHESSFQKLHFYAVFLLIALLTLAPSFAARPLPNKILWAWQRPENLKFIDPNEFGIAYLACRMLLSNDDVKIHWRNQYLKIPDSAVLIPTIRIDTDPQHPAKLSDQQIDTILKYLTQISARPHTSEIQIDFDALESERAFCRKLLERLRKKLPGDIPLSITALASWCMFDNWIKDLPVDETVPMMFSLGRDRQKLLLYFQGGKEFLNTGCCKSLGISLEDQEINNVIIPLMKKRKIPVRVYVFSKTAWNAKKVEAVRKLLGNQ